MPRVRANYSQKLDALLEYAGAAARSGDLFAQKSIAKKAAKIFELFSTDFQVRHTVWVISLSRISPVESPPFFRGAMSLRF